MTHSAWALLEIEPTTDEGAIRRAYARRLKVTRPDEDPAAFQALIAAREQAFAEARAGLSSLAPMPMPMPTASRDAAADGEEPAPVFQDMVPDFTAEETPFAPLSDEAMVVDIAAAPPPAPDAAWMPVISDIAPLEAGPTEWSTAEVLSAAVPTPNGSEPAKLETWLDKVRRLPLVARRQPEAAFARAIFDAWREPDGRLTARRIAATKPAVLAAGGVFGWPREDGTIAATLLPRDAGLLIQVARDVMPSDPDDPALAMVRVGRRRRLPLHAGDAAAFLATHPFAHAAYEAMRRRSPVPGRTAILPLFAPHLWAILNKRWLVALATAPGIALAAVLAMVALEGTGGTAAMLAVAAWLAWAAVAVPTARHADRLMVAAAARAARKAARKCVIDPVKRRNRLFAAGKKLPWFVWLPIGATGGFFMIAPYVFLFGATFKALEYLASLHTGQALGSATVPAALLLIGSARRSTSVTDGST